MYERIYVKELKQNYGQDAGFMLTKMLLVENYKCEQMDLSDRCQNYWQQNQNLVTNGVQIVQNIEYKIFWGLSAMCDEMI